MVKIDTAQKWTPSGVLYFNEFVCVLTLHQFHQVPPCKHVSKEGDFVYYLSLWNVWRF